MGLKYYAYFNSTAWAGVTSTRYKVEIYDTAFSGTATEVCTGGNPFSEKELNNEETTYGVKGCRFEIEIVSDTVTVDDFYTLEGMSHRVKLYDAPLVGDMTLVRDGYLLSEDVQEVYQDGTKVIQLSGTDGLELLKTIPFEFSADKPYTGVMTGLLLLDRCITPMGLDLNVNTAFNYYQNGQSKADTFEPLAFFNLHAPLFEGKTCYDVLEMFTKTLRSCIFQEDGEWWFVHTQTPEGMTQSYRKWDSDFNFLSSDTFDTAKTVAFEGVLAPFDGNKLKKRSYKKVTTEVDLQGYVNKLRNADFQDTFLGEWTDSGVDGYSFGGLGTVKDPYYIQIDGYQPKNVTDFLNIDFIGQNVATLFTGGYVHNSLDKKVKIKGKVKGNGIKSAYCSVYLKIDAGSSSVVGRGQYLYLVLNESGEWVSLGVTNSGFLGATSSQINKLKHNIKIDLVGDNDASREEYTSFEVTSNRISDIIVKSNGYWGFLDGGLITSQLNLANYAVDDFNKTELFIAFYEGYEQIDNPNTAEWVRWADLKLEIIDTNIVAGLKKEKYLSEQSASAPNELNVEAYFGDHYDGEQFVSILGSDEITPTILWEDMNGNNVGELLMVLNRELLSLYYKPTSLYDGNIFGRVKKYDKIALVGFGAELININWNFDFKDGIGKGLRYLMTYDNYGTFNNSKLGVYDGGKEISYNNEYPTGAYEYDEVPLFQPDLIARMLTHITQNTVFSDGYLTFSKISDESGINWYDSITGEETDFFRTTPDGFTFKSETNPYEVILDFTELTANTRLIIPPLNGDSSLVTTETGWLLEGNALTATKSIGSTTAFDWTLIRNNATIATIKSTGLHLSNLTTNYLPKHTSGGLANSLAFDNGTNFVIGTNTAIDSYSRLYVFGGANGANIDARGGGGGYDQGIFDAQGSDYATTFHSAHLRYQGIGALGTTFGYSNANLADLTYNYTGNDRAFLIRSVYNNPLIFGVNNAQVARIASTGLHLSVLSAATTDTDKFLVSDGGIVKYRTGTQILSDIGGFASPSGLTTNYVTKWNGTALANSLIFDNGTNVGVGTNAPSYKLSFGTQNDQRFALFENTGGANMYGFGYGSATGTTDFYANGTIVMSAKNGGNVGIGTTSPSAKLTIKEAANTSQIALEVNGLNIFGFRVTNENTSSLAIGNDFGGAFATRNLTLTQSGSVGIGTTSPQQKQHNNISLGGVGVGLMVSNDATNATAGRGVGVLFAGTSNENLAQIEAQTLTASNNTGGLMFKTSNAGTLTERLRIDQNGNIGIGSSSLTGISFRNRKNMTGLNEVFGSLNDGIIQSDATVGAYYNYSTATTAAAAFTIGTLSHYTANQGTFGAGSAVTNQFGFIVNSNVVGATNNYGFYGNIPSGTNRWNLFMNGTANNYLAGNLGIGTTNLTGYNLRVTKNLTGAASVFGISQVSSNVGTDATTQAVGFYTGIGVVASATIPILTHYGAGQATFNSSTVTTQTGFHADASIIGATNNYGFRGQIPSGTGRWNLYMDGTANNYLAGNLGIGTTSLSTTNLYVAKNMTGGTAAFGVLISSPVQSDVTSAAYGIYTQANTQAAAFTLGTYTHFAATQNPTLGAGSAITTQEGFLVSSTMIGASNNRGFRGQIPIGANRWNLYMDGTANNYLAGNVGIGVATPNRMLHIGGAGGAAFFKIEATSATSGNVFAEFTNAGGTTYFGADNSTGTGFSGGNYASIFGAGASNATVLITNGVPRLTVLPTSGNVGIGTTTPTYKLDVTGTGHFTGSVIFDTVPSSLQDATTANHLVRHSQWIGSTTVKYLQLAVKTISLTNITLSGTQTVNGVALVATDRILVAGQTAGAENGIWVVAAGAWTRATDSDTDVEIRGYIVSISNGTYAGYKYINTNTSTITVGTTAVTYSEFSNNIEIDPVFTAWRDTTRTANTFWAAPNGSNGASTWRAIVAADIPTLNQSTTGSAATLTTGRTIEITGDLTWLSPTFNGSANVTAVGTLATVNANVGTFRSVTVNAKGLVTAATNPLIVLTSDVSGILPIANGGTGSATQNFVDLTTSQLSIAGAKGFTSNIVIKGVTIGTGNLSTVTNISIGDNSMQALTTAHNNIGIGSEALRYNTSGFWNTAIGSLSLTANVSGTENVALGYSSLAANTSGTRNVAIGMAASSSITTGSNNIAIGYAAGYSYSGGGGLLTTTSNSIFLGYGTMALANGGTNETVIGNIATGNGSNTVTIGNSSITGNFFNGTLKYGTLLKPNNVAGTSGQFLKTSGTQDLWATIGHADISDLSSYTGFDSRFVALAGSYANPTWITSLAWAKLTGVPTTFTAAAHTLDSHSNVTITSNSSGEILKWNGSVWINNTLDEANIVDKSTSQTLSGVKNFGNGLLLFGDTEFSLLSVDAGGSPIYTTGVSGTNSLAFAIPSVISVSGATVYSINNSSGLLLGGTIHGGSTPTERLHVNGKIRYSTQLKPNNIAGTNGQFLGTNGTQDIWKILTTSDVSGLTTLLDAKQATLSGTGLVKSTAGTISYLTDNSSNWDMAYGWGNHASGGYLTTTLAASTYQPLLPSGTAGQFLVRNASNALEFLNLELEPQGLSSNKIAVGDSANYLSEYDNFEYREGRYVAIFKDADPTKAFYAGMYGTSNNSFVTASGGSLVLKGENGIYIDGFTGFGNKMVIVDGDGRLGYTDIPSGSGGGGSTTLASQFIGFGSTTNLVTGVSKFKFVDDRVIQINNSGSSSVEIGRKFSTDNYGIFVNNGDLELFTTGNVNATIGATSQFKIGDKLRYYRNTNNIQLDSIYTAGEYLTIGNPVGDLFWINAINAKLALAGTEVTLGSTESSYMTFQNCKINWDTADCINGWSGSSSTPEEGDEVTLVFNGGEFKLKRKI